MKILFFIHGMTAGGAERQASLLCNHWAQSGREVVLATLFDQPSHYDLHPAIARRTIRARHTPGIRNHWNDLKSVRWLLAKERPDIVLAFLDAMNVKVLIAALGSGTPVIVSERVSPGGVFGIYPFQLALPVVILRHLVYPSCAALVVQTERVARWVRRWHLSRNVAVIPNAIEPASEGFDSDTRRDNRLVLSVGRLSRQKGHDILLRAFACVAGKFPDWRLRIIGDGGSRQELGALVGKLGLQDRAELAPVQKNVAQAYRGAALFILPSRFEGFPNALLEAMQAGCAVVAADCPAGPREIISDGVDGILFRNEGVSDLAAKLDALMVDDALRLRLGERARNSVKKYEPEMIFPLWDRLLDDTVGGKMERKSENVRHRGNMPTA